MFAWETFWLGVFLGPIFWTVVGAILLKLLEDLCDHLERKHNMRKWDKDEKRKYKLEKELEKLNGRGH